MGLDEPPEDVKTPPQGLAVAADELSAWWLEFSNMQGVRISSLMKAIVPQAEGTEVVAVISATAQMDALEDIRFAFNKFINGISGGRLQTLRIEKGELPDDGRRPYTEKEKLDAMISKHPEWQEMIEKLQLRIP